MFTIWLYAVSFLFAVDGFVFPLQAGGVHHALTKHNNERVGGYLLDNLKVFGSRTTHLPAFVNRKGETSKSVPAVTTIKTNSLVESKSANANSFISSSAARLNYRRLDTEESTDVAVSVEVDSPYEAAEHIIDAVRHNHHVFDPSMVEFVGTKDPAVLEEQGNVMTLEEAQAKAGSLYPFAAMMQGSAVYIAAHAGKIAVFHIPGELIENEETADHILADMALCWLLGMKIVIVVDTRSDSDSCQVPLMDGTESMNRSHECHNALRITNAQTLRAIEEEAGFLRTEIERKLNRCLRSQNLPTDATSLEGNIVSGNFYTAQQFGIVRGQDFQYTGYTSSVNQDSIKKVLNNNDVVLLSTVGLSPYGELVNVNGYHLAATVAASLEASKLIYVANDNSAVLRKKGERTSIQELPLSFSKSITSYHQVKCHNTGFATFELARTSLDTGAVELLLHLGWSNWALDRGVHRAHIINPSDGALLEELFTSKNGANTCLYHDEDGLNHEEGTVAQEDWDEFFASARGDL